MVPEAWLVYARFSRLESAEATGGFEPPIAVLQTAALPLGYVAVGWEDAELYLYVSIGGGTAPPKCVIVRVRV